MFYIYRITNLLNQKKTYIGQRKRDKNIKQDKCMGSGKLGFNS